MNEMRETALCKHYTVKEMAELFGVSRGKLDRLARQGKIKKDQVWQQHALQCARSATLFSECEPMKGKTNGAFPSDQQGKAPSHYLTIPSETMTKSHSNKKRLTGAGNLSYFITALLKSAEPANSNNKSVAYEYTPFNACFFLCVAQTHPKNAQRFTKAESVYLWWRVMGKVSPFAVFH